MRSDRSPDLSRTGDAGRPIPEPAELAARPAPLSQGAGDQAAASSRRPRKATTRRQQLAAAGLLLAAGLVAVAVRAVGPTLDRLAWAASIDLSAQGSAEVVRQQGRSDCGPAALKMILNHYGIRGATLPELEAATGMGPDGTSLLALKRTAEQHGLAGQGLRLPVTRLRDIPMPAIAHVHGDHFVVIRSAGNELVIDDPSLGRLRMTSGVFERSWDGVVLAFTPTALPIPRTARDAVRFPQNP